MMDRTAVAVVAALDDDVRRALYEFVRSAGTPVTREAAAGGVGISRNLAAFHLDKLVDLGLLEAGFGQPVEGRRVGRAPKRYRPAAQDFAVRVPERTPEVLAAILVEAVTTEGADERAEQACSRVAHAHGRTLGAQERLPGRVGAERALAASRELLARHGFEPYVEPERPADVRLRNCPFHPLADLAPAFVCGLNRAYLEGVVDGLGATDRLVADLDPRVGECCVVLRASSA
jgi:predicted ArsR family transcriptional regulator